MSRFTHITQDGMPVLLLEAETSRSTQSLVRTRSGRDILVSDDDLYPIGQEAADAILEDVGLRSDQAVQEDDSNRTTLARWAQRLDVSRKTLVDAIGTVLGTTGNDGPGYATRRTLERALLQSGEDLASFWP